MSDVDTNLGVLGRNWSSSHAAAWEPTLCPQCGAPNMVRVAALLAQEGPGKGEPEDDGLRWLRCAACGSGAVASGGEVHPAPRPFGSVEGLPEVDARIWDEARTCFGAAAYTAAVMLCRKLLFHIAVDKGLPASNARGRAPGFQECVNHLESRGVITKTMLGWVDRIKDVGNDANHEVTPVTKGDAEAVGAFTQQLLTLAYALDAMMKAQGVATDDEVSQ